MTNHINIRPLGSGQVALDLGNQTYYIRNRDGLIDYRPYGQGDFNQIGYINPIQLPNMPFPLPPSIFGK